VRSIVIVGEHTHENSRKTAEVVKIIYAASVILKTKFKRKQGKVFGKASFANPASNPV